jgi:hypothetical protein
LRGGLILRAAALTALLAGCAANQPGILPAQPTPHSSAPAPPAPTRSPGGAAVRPGALPTDLEGDPLAGKITPGAAQQVASRLTARPRCDAGTPEAELAWLPASRPGGAQVVQLGYLAGGFTSGGFKTTGSLPPDLARYVWLTLNPGDQTRYWRVLTRHGDSWMPSQVATFHNGPC